MSDHKVVPFNPLDKSHLGETVAQALLRREPTPLGELQKFLGAGIYAIYYVGDHPAYGQLAAANRNGHFRAPIYAGRAEPSGNQKGSEKTTAGRGTKLFSRLSKHRESIKQVENLELADFHFRFLVVDEIWIPLGEALMINRFQPVWNAYLTGFGNHDPGAGRRRGLRPLWDTMHPGRSWANALQERDETPAQLTAAVRAFISDHEPPDDPLKALT